MSLGRLRKQQQWPVPLWKCCPTPCLRVPAQAASHTTAPNPSLGIFCPAHEHVLPRQKELGPELTGEGSRPVWGSVCNPHTGWDALECGHTQWAQEETAGCKQPQPRSVDHIMAMQRSCLLQHGGSSQMGCGRSAKEADKGENLHGFCARSKQAEASCAMEVGEGGNPWAGPERGFCGQVTVSSLMY